MKYHYVYKITKRATGEFYVGVRSSDVFPTDDVYHGSGTWIIRQLRKIGKNRAEICERFSAYFDKKIVGTYDSRKSAWGHEQSFIYSYGIRYPKLIKNRAASPIRTAYRGKKDLYENWLFALDELCPALPQPS